MTTIHVRRVDTGEVAEVPVDVARHLIQQRRAVQVEAPKPSRRKSKESSDANADSNDA